MMRTGFDADMEQFRDSARKFFQREIAPHSERWREANIVDREAFLKAGEMGYLCMWIDEKYGGLGVKDFRYEQILIDEKVGQVIGLWRQVADAQRDDGSTYEIAGIGGSWFRYGGDMQWAWQRDWFDLGNAAALFLEMMSADVLSDGMTARMHRALGHQPGHYPRRDTPAPLWPTDR